MEDENSYQEEKQVVEYSPEEPAPPEEPPQLASAELKMDLNTSHNEVKDLEVKSGNANDTFDINSTSCITVCDSTLEEECGSTITISDSTISSLSNISMSDVNATGYLSASCICECGDVNDIKTAGKLSQKESDISKEDLRASLKKEIEKDVNYSSINEATFLKSPENDIKNETLDCQPSFEFVENENTNRNIQNTYGRMSASIEENDGNISSPYNTAVSTNLNSTEYDLVMALESLNINSESKGEETFLSVENENSKDLHEDSLQDSVYSCNEEQIVTNDVINETITTFQPSDLKIPEENTKENFNINDTCKTENNQSETLEQLEITENKSIFQPTDLNVSEEDIKDISNMNDTFKTENNQSGTLEQLKITENKSIFQPADIKVLEENIKEISNMNDTFKTENNQSETLEQLEITENKSIFQPTDFKVFEEDIKEISNINNTFKTENSQSETLEQLEITENKSIFQSADIKDSEENIKENSNINDTLKTENNLSETLEQLEITENKSIFQPADTKVSEDDIKEISNINDTFKAENNQSETLEQLEITEHKSIFQTADNKVSEENIKENSNMNDTFKTENNQSETLEQLEITENKSIFQPSDFKVPEEDIKEISNMNDTFKTENNESGTLEQLKITENKSIFQPADIKVSEEDIKEISNMNDTFKTENSQSQTLEQLEINENKSIFQSADIKVSEENIKENSNINDTFKTENNQSETLEQLKITENKSISQPADFKVSEEAIELIETLKTENNQTEKLERLDVSEEDIKDELEQSTITERESTFEPSDFKVSMEIIVEDFTISDTIKTENSQTEKLEQSKIVENDTVPQCVLKTPRKSRLSDSSNVSFIDYNSLLEASPSVFNEKMPKYEKQADLLLKINSLQQTLAKLEMEITKKDRLILKYQMNQINKAKNNDSSNNVCSNITENVKLYQENLKQAQLKIAELQKENLEKGNKIKKLEQDLNEMEGKKLEIILETENITKEKEKAYWLLEQSDKVMLDMTNKYQALNKKYINLEKEKDLWKTAFEEIKGKYDLAKLVVKGLKENEEIYKKENDELKTKLTEYTTNYETFKSKALTQINEANKENLKLHSQVADLTKQVRSRRH